MKSIENHKRNCSLLLTSRLLLLSKVLFFFSRLIFTNILRADFVNKEVFWTYWIYLQFEFYFLGERILGNWFLGSFSGTYLKSTNTLTPWWRELGAKVALQFHEHKFVQLYQDTQLEVKPKFDFHDPFENLPQPVGWETLLYAVWQKIYWHRSCSYIGWWWNWPQISQLLLCWHSINYFPSVWAPKVC
jgi:hypothetical protein